MSNKTYLTTACLIAASWAASALPVQAGGPSGPLRLAGRNAVESCQGALPIYDNALRKRPLGITNESNSAIFVTCSMSSADTNYESINTVTVYINPNDGIFTCILVPGTGIDSTVEAYTRSTRNEGSLHWDARLMDRPYWRNFNLSCRLPPGAQLIYIENDYFLLDDWPG